jgi:hypothetical protein
MIQVITFLTEKSVRTLSNKIDTRINHFDGCILGRWVNGYVMKV